jgi:hypothetical protein
MVISLPEIEETDTCGPAAWRVRAVVLFVAVLALPRFPHGAVLMHALIAELDGGPELGRDAALLRLVIVLVEHVLSP